MSLIEERRLIEYQKKGVRMREIKRTGMLLPVLVILGLLVPLFGLATPIMAANVSGGVTPNTIMNDGTHRANFTWDIWDWSGNASYYTFAIHNFGDLFSPIYIQYSDGAGTDSFLGVSVPLQSVNGTVGSPTTHLRNPEYPGAHVWTVPSGFTPGTYWAVASLYLEGETVPDAQAIITLDIVTSHEVGGTALPADKSRLLAPWAALAGCVGVLAFLGFRRKREA